MIAPVPKLKVEVHLEKLAEITHNMSEVSEFEFVKTRNELLKLIEDHTPEPERCYFALALLFNAVGKIDDAYKYFENALRLAPQDAAIFNGYSIVSMNAGDLRKGTNLILDLYDREPMQKRIVIAALERCERSGYFAKSVEIFKRYKALTMNEHNAEIEKMGAIAQSAHSILTRSDLLDDDIMVRLEKAIQVVRENEFVVRRTQPLFLRDGTVIYHLYIDANVEKCAELNFDIADALVENFDDAGGDLFSVVCRPLAFYISTNELFS